MIGNADLEAKIVEATYRGACDPAELRRAIELMPQYFDSSGMALAELDKAAPESGLTIGVRTFDQSFLANYAYYAAFDPAPLAYAALPTGTMSTTDRIFSSDFLRRNIFLNEFLRPQGVVASLGGTLISASGRFAMLSIFQANDREIFDDDDIARADRLTPHLTRALQIRRLFLQSEARGHVLEAIIERNPAGLIGLPAKGPALFVNDAARHIAAESDGITLDIQGRLIASDRTAARRLAHLHADVVQGGTGGIERLRRPSGRPAYVVLVSPLPSSDDAVLRAGGGVLVAIHDPGRSVVAVVEQLARTLHLPLGAAKVLGALLDGIDLKDYAERETISMNTVKFHLKTAFDRTDTRSQVDLVRRALLALNDLAPYLRKI
ncbi:MAG TPA: LuxR C-terminal-related transcriptional regulator [Xanthobacteraceae bacterium]|jgi:PAS domain-containing protein